MSALILDTNHLAAALDDGSPVYQRILTARKQGQRIGTCAPVLCELAVGIAQTARKQQNWQALDVFLQQIRIWPIDTSIARVYGDLYQELRAKGRVLSQVDMMVAALARHARLTILTTDRDFEALPDIKCENWIAR